MKGVVAATLRHIRRDKKTNGMRRSTTTTTRYLTARSGSGGRLAGIFQHYIRVVIIIIIIYTHSCTGRHILYQTSTDLHARVQVRVFCLWNIHDMPFRCIYRYIFDAQNEFYEFGMSPHARKMTKNSVCGLYIIIIIIR